MITLDDLRVLIDEVTHIDGALIPGGALHDVRPLTPAEFDRIATERGYVHGSTLKDDLARAGYVKPAPASVCAGRGYCALSVSAREVLPEYDQEAT